MYGYTSIGLGIYPQGLTHVLVSLSQRYALPELYITENGCAVGDDPDPQGFVRDYTRIHYLHDHIAAAYDAIQAGVNLRGYFVWSLFDNFEWAEGYAPRFWSGACGLCYAGTDTPPELLLVPASDRRQWSGKLERTPDTHG